MKGVIDMLKMKKPIFHTFDIFNIKDDRKRREFFDVCHKQSLKCGLTCKCIMEDVMKIEMWGTKCQFLKYYFKTLLKCEYKWGGIKRLLKFVFMK